jgi:hypothetical protein
VKIMEHTVYVREAMSIQARDVCACTGNASRKEQTIRKKRDNFLKLKSNPDFMECDGGCVDCRRRARSSPWWTVDNRIMLLWR